jgi:hypothetical protein
MIRPQLRAALCAAVLFPVAAQQAPAATLYFEPFNDDSLQPGTATNLGTIAGGILSFSDSSATAKPRISILQTLTSPVMSFSFDVVAPVTVPDAAQNELLIRAGIGTAADMLSSGDAIVEAILYRTDTTEPIDHTRGDYQNNGNETIVLIVNNQDAMLTFNSPVDGLPITLNAFQYSSFVRNNLTSAWGLLKGTSTMTDRNGADPGPGTMTRWAIGSGSNGHLGSSAIDNVRLVDGVSFIPEPSTAALLLSGCGFFARRRRA